MEGERRRAEALRVLEERYGLAGAELSPLPGGRVHRTFLAEAAGRRWVLQKLNAFFENSPALGVNCRAIQQLLAEKGGPPAPELAPAADGALLARDEAGAAWRLTVYLPFRPARKKSPSLAAEAAGLLGRAHQCLNTPFPVALMPLPPGEFTNYRLSAPEEFEQLPERYRRHPHLPEVLPLIQKAAVDVRLLPAKPAFVNLFSLRDMIVHGDPKADNFLVDDEGRARAVIDWDTAGPGHQLLDLGEMARSFAGGGAPFSEVMLGALVAGYLKTGPPLRKGDLSMLPAVVRALVLSLARRYLTDALAEVYFKWDPGRYPSLFEQNRSRARELLDLADELLDRDLELTRFLES